MSKREPVVTAPDRRSLEEMIRSQRTVGDPFAAYLDALQRRLDRATIVDAASVDAQVATMHSRLRIRNASDGKQQIVKLVYPYEGRMHAENLSVLTNLGTALLGSRSGDLVEWWAFRGKTAVLLEEVISQPAINGARVAELVKE